MACTPARMACTPEATDRRLGTELEGRLSKGGKLHATSLIQQCGNGNAPNCTVIKCNTNATEDGSHIPGGFEASHAMEILVSPHSPARRTRRSRRRARPTTTPASTPTTRMAATPGGSMPTRQHGVRCRTASPAKWCCESTRVTSAISSMAASASSRSSSVLRHVVQVPRASLPPFAPGGWGCVLGSSHPHPHPFANNPLASRSVDR
jgi:hypothetical protein